MENRTTGRIRRWRSGPQPKASEELRTKTISLRLTPAEHAELVAKAKEHNMPVGRYCHQGIMKQKMATPIPEINIKQWSYLGKVAGGLTTLAKKAGQGETVYVTREDFQVMCELKEEVQRLRILLITNAGRLSGGDDNEG